MRFDDERMKKQGKGDFVKVIKPRRKAECLGYDDK